MNKAQKVLKLFEASTDILNNVDFKTKKLKTEYVIATPTGTNKVKGNIYGYIGVTIDDDRNGVFTHLPTGRSFYTVPRMIIEQILSPLESDSVEDVLTHVVMEKPLASLEPYANDFNRLLKDSKGEMVSTVMPEFKKMINKFNDEFKQKLEKAMKSGEIDTDTVQYYMSGKMIPRLR